MLDKAQIIKNRLTMYDVLSQYGIKYDKRMKCPLHNGQDLNFVVKENTFICYSHCGSGDIITFVQKLFALSFNEALHKIDMDFNLGLYEKMSARKKLELARQCFNRKKQIESTINEKEAIKNKYWAAFEELERLEENKKTYAPKTPEEKLHPLFVEALQKLSYQTYLLGCAEMEEYNYEHKNSGNN